MVVAACDADLNTRSACTLSMTWKGADREPVDGHQAFAGARRTDGAACAHCFWLRVRKRHNLQNLYARVAWRCRQRKVMAAPHAAFNRDRYHAFTFLFTAVVVSVQCPRPPLDQILAADRSSSLYR